MKPVTLGILGGGQLGRMSALAAARLGINVIVFCRHSDSPAAQIAHEAIFADYDDKESLKTFSEKVDVISYEFENIPIETVDYLSKLKPNSVRPGRTLLEVSQNRVREKQFLNDIGIETAFWKEVESISDIKNTIKELNNKNFIVKTARFGYDGKGQILCTESDLNNDTRLKNFLDRHKGGQFIIESVVNFKHELSVIIARDISGNTAIYGPMLNEHQNHVLKKTTMPAPVSSKVSSESIKMTERLAHGVDLVGVLALELFLTHDETLLANEIAPRTHNSGHWTMDGCAVSQFEQHIRTVCGFPVGSSKRHSDAVMINLLGKDITSIDQYLSQENACLHLYGKHDIQEGRKMGHVTFLKPKS